MSVADAQRLAREARGERRVGGELVREARDVGSEVADVDQRVVRGGAHRRRRRADSSMSSVKSGSPGPKTTCGRRLTPQKAPVAAAASTHSSLRALCGRRLTRGPCLRPPTSSPHTPSESAPPTRGKASRPTRGTRRRRAGGEHGGLVDARIVEEAASSVDNAGEVDDARAISECRGRLVGVREVRDDEAEARVSHGTSVRVRGGGPVHDANVAEEFARQREDRVDDVAADEAIVTGDGDLRHAGCRMLITLRVFTACRTSQLRV